MATTEERLAKAGTAFKRMDAEIKELRKEVAQLKEFLGKKYTTMNEVFQWYMKRLQEETDGLTNQKK
jgi:prefoldin subunit 5